MNNKEFVAELAQQTGYKQKDVERLVRTFVDTMGDIFEGEEPIVVPNFGVFEVKKKLERIVVNPGTQKRMLVPPKLVLTFKPTASIKEKVKNL